MKSQLIKHQIKEYTKTYHEDGKEYTITAKVRYDDQCGNGHNTFSITGEIWRTRNGKRFTRDCETCGCIHEDIEKHFPELKPFIKWHLVSSDEPMHYIGNGLYWAGFGKYSERNIDNLKSTIVFGAVQPNDSMVNLGKMNEGSLTEFLNIRKPLLMMEFQKAVESLGLIY